MARPTTSPSLARPGPAQPLATTKWATSPESRFRRLGEAVDAHLEVFVLAKWSDHRFDQLANSFNRRALPNADTNPVIVRGSVNRERKSFGQTGRDCLILSLREPLRIRDAVDRSDVHWRCSFNRNRTWFPTLLEPSAPMWVDPPKRSGASEGTSKHT